ncbi:MAG: hypothetical protein IKA47_11410 [Oscillospiraceae bacterium]|nr:hypothetical protein [Oscillospiraceae bacterium]MBR2422030.1 hypothetical protein [Oscillospiraceae bacterium]
MKIFICAIAVAVIGQTAGLALGILIERRRKKQPRCKDCFYCKPIPKDAGWYFLSTERHCTHHRGNETLTIDDKPISVVSLDDYCSGFIHKDRMEDAYV